jgi:hypothetical protein
MSPDGVIGVGTTLCDPQSGVRMPVAERDSSLLQNVQSGSVRAPPPHRLKFNGYRDFFPVVKRPGREVNRSSPPSSDLKNERSCTSVPLMRLHGVDRQHVAFYLLPYGIIMLCVCVFGGGGMLLYTF